MASDLERVEGQSSAPDLMIIEARAAVTQNAQKRVLTPCTIVVRDGQILELHESSAQLIEHDLCARGMRVTRKVLKPQLIAFPGFINCHAHAAEVMIRGGYTSGRLLYDWQWNLTYPAIRQMSAEDVYRATQLFCVESLLSGTTTVVDNTNAGRAVENVEASIRAYSEMGMRVRLARIFAVGPLQSSRLLDLASSVQGAQIRVDPRNTLESLGAIRQDLSYLMRRCNSRQGMARVWPAPHKPNRTSRESIILSHELVSEFGGKVSQPCSETREEQAVGALTAIEYLNEAGCLNNRTLLAHCVHVHQSDMELIGCSAATLAHLPVANAFLGSGIAPVPSLLQLGVAVGLGTDNGNCNDTANMVREMSTCALLHRAALRDAKAIGNRTLLSMMTDLAAKAIGESESIGSIEPGKRADVILVDLAHPNMMPCNDVVGTFVAQAYGHEIDTVIVDGQVVVEGRRLARWNESALEDLSQYIQRRSTEIYRTLGETF